MTRSILRLGTVLLALTLTAPAHADPVKCQKTLLAGLRKYKKTYLKANEKCLDAENEGKISGPCPDVNAQVKIGSAVTKINPKIDAACLPADLATLGYATDCNLETPETAAESNCTGMPATTGAELAACLECWKAAELRELVAIVYASHAVEMCDVLDSTSTKCSEFDCTTPLPIQEDVTGGAEDCQKAIGKATFKYVVAREKVLEACGLLGQTRAQCLDIMTNPKVALALAAAESKKMTAIKNKCGNRTPVAVPPFCCVTGTGNACTVAATRDDCTMVLGGTVSEGKTCDTGSGKCAPVTGGGTITWWENCPEGSTCPGAAVDTMDHLINCVDSTGDAIADELLCLQFPPGSGWPCPSESTTTTTTTTSTTSTT
jgi:hypothetical protein